MENDNLTAVDPSPIMEEETNHDANGYAIENDQETTTKNEEVCTKLDDDDDVDTSASKKTPPEEKSPKKRKTKKVTKRKKVVESSDEEEEASGSDDKKQKKKRKKKPPSKKTFERRNIRDVMSEDKLEASTINAMAEEQLRLQRLQQAQRDAFANEVLREFDLGQLSAAEIKEELEETSQEDEEILQKIDMAVDNNIKNEVPTKIKAETTIDLSSDEDHKKAKAVVSANSTTKGFEIKMKIPQINGLSITIPSATAAKFKQIEKNRENEKQQQIQLQPSSTKPKKEDSDSSDIQILSEVEESDEDDPDNSGMHTNDKLNARTSDGKVVVNVSEKNPDQLIYVADSVQNVIKPHQIGGVRFLYDNIIESPSIYEKSQGFGCILAHSMGLGKTLQIVTFTEVFLRATKGRNVLVIVPVNTIQNWNSEYKQWLPHQPFKVHILNDNLKSIAQRSVVICNWREQGGVLLMGYEMFRLLAGTKAQQRKKKVSKKKPVCIDIEEEDKEKDILVDLRKILVDPGPDLVICDEGHRIKNAHASISQVLKAIKTKRRVVLTGYPLQNNLLEYWCMVDFVRPNYLGTKTEFSNMFERPIQNGQCVDSTQRDKRLMMHRAHVLHSQLLGFVQRRSHRVLRKNLPPKFEHVLLVKMTPFQRKLYVTFTEDLLAQKSMANPLKAFAVCCKIWNHPDVLCNFLRKREATEDEDLELEELAGSSKNKNGRKKAAGRKANNINKLKEAEKSNGNHPGFEGVPQNVMNGNGYDNGAQQQQYLEQQQQYPNQFQQYQQQQFNQFHGNNDFNQQQQYPNFAQQYHNNKATTTATSANEFGGGSFSQNFQGYNQQMMNTPQHADHDSQLRQQLMTPPGGSSNLNQMSSPLRQHLMSQSSNSNQPLNMLEQQVEQVPADKLNNGANGGGVPGQYNFQMNGGGGHHLQPKKSIVIQSTTGFDPFSTTSKDLYHEKKDEISYDWANGMFNDYKSCQIENSQKFVIFFKILEETIKCSERILLFSQSLLTLDLIEDFLHQRTVPVSGEKWTNNVNYFRLDGSTPSMERDRLINAFNKAEPLKIPLFLVSTRAGSLGINLVGANRVVIFDASWNPCHDSQAVCRVYRYGQTKPCYIYRLVSDKCLERKIYDRQINKQGMSDRVVDEANPDNYLSSKDIHSLWDEEDTQININYKSWNQDNYIKKYETLGDRVLAQVVMDHADSLSTSPFTHESLLVDRKEKKLTKQEKRVAELYYQQEKTAQISYTRPSYAAFYPKGQGGGQGVQPPPFPEVGPDGIPIVPKNQNYIGCRKESWKPPAPGDGDDFDPMSQIRAKQRPMYNNGLGGAGSGPSTSQHLQAAHHGGGGGGHQRSARDPNKKFPIEALARREGVKLQEVLVPRDIVIPTKNQNPIALKAGQRVMLIKTPKGVYLRYRDQIVKIRVPNGLLPFGGSGNSSSSITSGNSTGATSDGSGSFGGKIQTQQPQTQQQQQQQKQPLSKPDVVTLHSSGDDE